MVFIKSPNLKLNLNLNLKLNSINTHQASQRIYCCKPDSDQTALNNHLTKLKKNTTGIIRHTKIILRRGFKLIKHSVMVLKLGLKPGSSPLVYGLCFFVVYVVVVVTGFTIATLVLFDTNVWFTSNPYLALYGSHNAMVGLLLAPFTIIYVMEGANRSDLEIAFKTLQFYATSFPCAGSFIVLGAFYGGTLISTVIVLRRVYKTLPEKHKRTFVLITGGLALLSVGCLGAFPAYAATDNTSLPSTKTTIWGFRTIANWYWSSFDKKPSVLTTQEGMDSVVKQTVQKDDQAFDRCMKLKEGTTRALEEGDLQKAAITQAASSECCQHLENFRSLRIKVQEIAGQVKHGLTTPGEFAGQAVQDVTREALKPYAEAGIAGAASAVVREAAAREIIAREAGEFGRVTNTGLENPPSPTSLPGVSLWD